MGSNQHRQLPENARWRDLAIPAYGPTVLVSIGQGAILPLVALSARDLGGTVGQAAFIVALIGIGQTLRVPIGAGTTDGQVMRLKEAGYRFENLKRGDAVMMVARRDGIEVSTAGEALDAGGAGASVRVKNASSGQIVRMRVSGPGTVEPVDSNVNR